MNGATQTPSHSSPTVSVIGGGRMGAGIVHAFLLAGANVRLIEASEVFAQSARASVVAQVQASADRKLIDEEVDGVLARLSVETAIESIRDSVLVIESVPENFDIKSDVLKRASEAMDDSAILASNTSSISIDELSRVTPRPEKFLGLHFFNPVPVSLLVEIVRGSATSEDTVFQARQWVEKLKKTPIVVRDSPGFASSRLGVALGLEAIRMVEEGVATPEDIDAAMTLGYKHPVGPLRLTDIVGLDVRLGISRYLQPLFGERFAPPKLLVDMVDQGKLGQKSGEGFYEWPSR
jgi:3-hydroxybutyryl-CoA dehydrogenase